MAQRNDSPDCLDTPWPTFLDDLDRDPQAAMAGFHDCTWRIFKTRPPSILRSLSRERQEDVVANVVVACCKDDLRRLRTYRPMGRPFSGWVATLLFREAWREIYDKNHKKRPQPEAIDDHLDLPAPKVPDLDPQRDEIVRRCLAQLSAKCQAYVHLFADGMKPREIVALLGLKEDENKSVSGDTRYCLRKLDVLLREEGIGPDELLT